MVLKCLHGTGRILLLAILLIGGRVWAQTLLWSDEFDGTSLDLSKWIVIDAEDKTHLNQLVHRLSPRQQEVLRLRLQAGLSYREIAEVTGLTIGNVGFHLHQAVRNLRDALAVG